MKEVPVVIGFAAVVGLPHLDCRTAACGSAAVAAVLSTAQLQRRRVPQHLWLVKQDRGRVQKGGPRVAYRAPPYQRLNLVLLEKNQIARG